MKRIFVSLSFMLTVGLATGFANEKMNVPDKVKEAFKKEFTGVESVNWSDLGDYQRAAFVFGGHRTEAYFNTDGELQGTVRDLLFDQLPLAVMKAIDNRFNGAGIMVIREITNIEGTSYRITFEAQHKTYRVKVDTGGNFSELTRDKN